MDIMKNKLHLDKVEVEQHQSKTTDDLQDKRNISFQENIALKAPMSMEAQIDQLMPPVHEGGDKLQKAPVNKNIYFPEDYAKTIQELIENNYAKTIEEYRVEKQKQEEVIDGYQKIFDKYELQILEYTAKANEATNEADKEDTKALVENIKELKNTLEIELRQKKSDLDELKIKLQPKEKDQAVLEYGKELPETLEDLWKKKDTILDSKNTQEKEKFLEEVSKVSQFLQDLDTISNYGTKKDKRFYDIVSKIDKKLVDISDVAAQVAGQLIDFKKLEKNHNDSLTTNGESLKEIVNDEMDFDLVDQEIEMKKSLINALNLKLGQPVKYPSVAITQEAKQEVKAIVRRTDKKFLKVTLQSYVDANIQIIADLLQHKNQIVEDEKNLKTEMNARIESLDSIEKGKNIHGWVKDIVNNQQNVLNSEDLKDKYQFIANVMRMDKFLHFTPMNPSNMTSDEKLFLSIVDFVRIHKRQLEDTARKVTVQIFNKLNPDYQEPKFDFEALKDKLDQRKDENALLDIDVKYKMYNPLENIEDFRLKEAADKRFKISDRKNGLTPEKKFNFRAKLSEEKTDCILAYEKLYKEVKVQLTKMLTDISANEKEDLAIFIASLSEPVQKITAIDKINPEVTLSWADDINIYNVATVVNQKYKDKGIDIDHVNAIEKQKIVKLRTYEKRLWNDQKYGSSSMEEMYLNIGKKAVDQAFYEKNSKFKKKLKDKVIAAKKAEYDKELVEAKKTRLKKKLDKAKEVFSSGEAIDNNNLVEKLVELKSNEALLKNKKMQEAYIKGIELLETYREELKWLVDRNSDEYQKVIKQIDWQLDALSETTAQVALSLVDFDKVKRSYKKAIEANNENIKKSKEEKGKEIEALSQSFEIVTYKYYLINAVKAGIDVGAEIDDDIKRLPEIYRDDVRRHYDSLKMIKTEDLDALRELYADAQSIEEEELKKCKQTIKENQKQVKTRTEEARLMGKTSTLFTFVHNLVKEKNDVLHSEQVIDKAKFLEKIVDINKFCLIGKCSIELGSDFRYLKFTQRYFKNQRQELDAAAREVVASMDNILLEDYQLPAISLSETLSKLKNSAKMDQVVQAIVAYKLYNPKEFDLDKRAKDINEFIDKFDLGQIAYSTEELVALMKEILKQRTKYAEEFYNYYETLKTKYKGQLSDDCIGFIATQSEVHKKFVALNRLDGNVFNYLDISEAAEKEFAKIKLRGQKFVDEGKCGKAQTLSNDINNSFEVNLMDKNDISEIDKIFMDYRTIILDNARA